MRAAVPAPATRKHFPQLHWLKTYASTTSLILGKMPHSIRNSETNPPFELQRDPAEERACAHCPPGSVWCAGACTTLTQSAQRADRENSTQELLGTRRPKRAGAKMRWKHVLSDSLS